MEQARDEHPAKKTSHTAPVSSTASPPSFSSFSISLTPVPQASSRLFPSPVKLPRLRYPHLHEGVEKETIQANPWADYRRVMKVELGGEVTLASKTPYGLVYAIQELKGNRRDLDSLLQLQVSDPNTIRVHERYYFDDKTFLIQECMDASLSEVIACPWNLKETQVAMICLEVGYQVIFEIPLTPADITWNSSSPYLQTLS
ncbi:hypothetical protein BDD12DRAFT_800354 [Trichophaea hybrida]|nr:hypothetical protein BDD12DRAFT_800354 [Trichophaea hybrida]